MLQSDFDALCQSMDECLAALIWDYLSALFEQET